MKKTNFGLKTFNNKSRKGTYVWIKEPNKPTNYYKFNEDNDTIDEILQYHKNKTTGKPRLKRLINIRTYKKGWQARITGTPKRKLKNPTGYSQADKYLNKIKAGPTIDQTIKSGITNTTIPNAYETTPQKTQEYTKQLLKNLVLDPQLLDIICTEENLKKITTRFEYRVLFKEQQNIIGTTAKFNITPLDLIEEIKKIIPQNSEVKAEKTPWIDKVLENNGYQKYEHNRNGNIKSITVTMIFRKAT